MRPHTLQPGGTLNSDEVASQGLRPATGAQFLADLKAILEEPLRILA